MRIARVFVWKDGRPDGHDEVRSVAIPRYATHEGTRFELRTWDVRYPQGQERVTDAFYDEAVSEMPAAPQARTAESA